MTADAASKEMEKIEQSPQRKMMEDPGQSHTKATMKLGANQRPQPHTPRTASTVLPQHLAHRQQVTHTPRTASTVLPQHLAQRQQVTLTPRTASTVLSQHLACASAHPSPIDARNILTPPPSSSKQPLRAHMYTVSTLTHAH